MSDHEAKARLAGLLDRYTAGSVLGLLGDVLADAAREAHRAGDEVRAEQLLLAEATLTVVGMGIDAALPG